MKKLDDFYKNIVLIPYKLDDTLKLTLLLMFYEQVAEKDNVNVYKLLEEDTERALVTISRYLVSIAPADTMFGEVAGVGFMYFTPGAAIDQAKRYVKVEQWLNKELGYGY